MHVALTAVGALVGLVVTIAPAPSQTGTEAGVAASEVELPPGYRDWGLIAVAREEGRLDDLRAILGNDVAVEIARKRQLPYPDGTMIARLAWSFDPLAESAEAFGHAQSFVAGSPKNGVQLMVKDAAKYASTGGWGFAQFDDGKPAGEAANRTCFPCHAIVKARDYVFNRYAP